MAYQTSCASYTSGRLGLSSATAVVADAAGREQTQHGSPLFPIACYAEDLSCFSVAWHWHEEFEFILAALGPIHVDVNKTRLTLQTGQGVFINSGALHAVEPAEGRALLHSGVFQPRLVGGMDTVFWQKLIRPLLQPGTPPFIAQAFLQSRLVQAPGGAYGRLPAGTDCAAILARALREY